MKQHEREFFVARIRSGIIRLRRDGFTLKVYSPTIEDEYEINEAYMDAYQDAQDDDILTQEEMVDWMRTKGLWTPHDDEKEKGLPKDIERFQIEAFRSRNDERKLAQIKEILFNGKKQLRELIDKKNSFQENTCEGIAAVQKSMEFIRRCTYLGKERYDIESDDIQEILGQYYQLIVPEAAIRELARSEPWRSLWVMNDSGAFDLFSKTGRELSFDQRNLLVWSKMYSNAYEASECPADDVIEDDDMFDGWSALQRQKREKDRLNSEVDATLTNEKIKNSGEIFLMAKTDKDIARIDSMNDTHSKIIKERRIATAKRLGDVQAGDFQDEKLEQQRMSNEQFKGKFRS